MYMWSLVQLMATHLFGIVIILANYVLLSLKYKLLLN